MTSWTALVAAATVACIPFISRDVEASWCQYDDPAHVLQELDAGEERDPDKIPCPEIGNAEERPEQLILPMPCGRHMVFRRVGFAVENALDHKRAYLGSLPDDAGADRLLATVSGLWNDHISGGFTDPEGGLRRRYVYIGKYEVTQPQFALLDLLEANVSERPDDPACKDYQIDLSEIRGLEVLPAVNLTWLDAVTFAFRYSAWLLSIDQRRIAEREPPYMPWEESAPGFFRLPAEVEWEFAARGGRVDQDTKADRSYYVSDGDTEAAPIDAIASLSTTEDLPPMGSEVFYVGGKAPNTLGLYDMVGNADEIVYDLFRPTRPDTLGGERGGFVVRGGSARQDDSEVGVGYRGEAMFFNRSGPFRSPVTGFRLLASVPMFVNKRGSWYDDEERINVDLREAISEAYQQLTVPSAQIGMADLAGPQADIKRLEQEHAEQLDALQRERARDEQRLADMNAQIETLRQAAGNTESLQARLASTQQELEVLQEARTAQTARLEALTAQVEDLGQAAGNTEKMQALVASTRQEIGAVQEERKILLARVGEMTAQLEALQAGGSTENLQALLASTRQELEAMEEERATNLTRLGEMTDLLASARAALDSSTARLHERDRRIKREQLNSLVLMAANINNVQRRISSIESLIKSLSADPIESEKPRVKEMIARSRQSIGDLELFNRANFDYYVNIVYSLAEAGEEAAASAARTVASDLATRELTALYEAQEEALQHVQEAIRAHNAVPQARLQEWLQQIIAHD